MKSIFSFLIKGLVFVFICGPFSGPFDSFFSLSQTGPWSGWQTARAENSTDSFNNGLQLYQQKKFADAINEFKNSVKDQPTNSFFWHNLGLSYYQNGQKGFALACLRRAEWLNPGIKSNNKVQELIISELPIKEIPHEIEWIHEFHRTFLSELDLNILLGLLAAMILFSGWSVLKILSRKQKNHWNWVVIVLLVCDFIIASLVFIKIFDQNIERATLLTEKISVFAVPQEKLQSAGLGIFDLYEGFEVVVLSKTTLADSEEWVQIQYPGAGTGWVKASEVMIHSKGF